MRRIVRVKCSWIEGKRDDWVTTFETVLNDGKIERGRSYIGFQSGYGEFYPFFLHMDGRLDFGSDCEDEDRYSQTNFLEKTIELGELFTINESDDEGRRDVTYRITAIVDL